MRRQFKHKNMIFNPNIHFNVNRVIGQRRRSGKILSSIEDHNFDNVNSIASPKTTYNVGGNLDLLKIGSSLKLNISYDHYFREGFFSDTIAASINLEL